MGRPRTFDHEEIIRLYKEDRSADEVGRLVGCSGRRVLEIVKANKVPSRPGHRRGVLDADSIVARYREGQSLEQIGKELSCSKAGVYNVLSRRSVPLRTGDKRHDLRDRLGFNPTAGWLKKELRKHGTVAEVARQHEVSYPSLISCMERLGVAREVWHGGPGGKTRRQEIPIKEAIKLSEEGHTYRELAAKYGVSYGVIVRRMADAGYKAPRDRMRKHPADAPYANAPWVHRKIMHELGITKCEICGEDRALDFCHIVAVKNGGPTTKENCLVLCPLHHRLYDTDKLDAGENASICRKVRKAKKLYGVY